MSLLQNLFGNAAEVDPQAIQAEFQAILIDQEQIQKSFKLFRDLFILTQHRLIVVDKQGMTGSKQCISSTPWKSVKKFSVETAGFMDGDGELRLWITGEHEPLKYELNKRVNIKEVYQYISYYVLTS